MAKFNGFSQDEIHQIHTKTGIQNGATKSVASRLRMKKASDKQVHTTKTIAQLGAPMEKNNNHSSIFDSDETIKSLQDAMHFQPLQKKTVDSNGRTNDDVAISNGVQCPTTTPSDECENFDPRFQGISLKDFEQHRKLVEEQNKQKKEILTKAIEQRIERTAVETKRIAEVKDELTKLDAELATDVAILRKEIDAVSLQYANIQKSYQQIESQFLKAKLELQMAREKKELLTEHLCTIISHNEDRKSKKLTELMEKVGLCADIQDETQ